MKRKYAVISAFLIICLALSACSLGSGRKQEDIDASEPVITVGEESVSYAMYRALFDSYLPYMQYAGQDPYESESNLASFREWLVDILSDDLITLYQAKQSGFELSAEQEEELERSTESEISELYNSFMKIAEQYYADDPSIPVTSYFESIVNEESEYYTGVAMSWEDYKENYRSEARHSAVVKAYREAVCAEFVPTEDDISDWYDSARVSDRENYTANPEKYKTDEENFERFFGKSDGIYPITYVPSGYSRIMDIVVTPKGELSSEYAKKLERMAAIKDEYADLMFEDAVSGSEENAARIEELLNEYRALKESTDTEYEEYISEARTKIDEALSELTSGASFRDVMLRYTEDTKVAGDGSSEGCAAFREKGELISLEYRSSDDWSDTVKAEFGKLEIGQYSEVFTDGESFRIIYYASDETAGDVELETIRADVAAVCAASVRDAQFEALLAEWKKDPALKVDYDLINTIGNKEEN